MLPFEGGLSGTENGTLLFAVLLAIIYLLYGSRRASWLKVAAKTLSVVLLAVLSVIQNAPWLLTLGLALCAAGDFFLAVEDRSERFFLAGLVAFLLGHIAYIVLFSMLPETAATLPVWLRTAIIAVVIFVALAMAAMLWQAAGNLRWPVMIYIMAVVAMASSAVTNGGGLITAGALSFMASDTILATERFMMKPDAPGRAFTGPAVWITYFAAQLLILFGVLAA
ncbi:lysoplasmalogenase [Oricola nitratireducens]|uniref:lysoplasmalogenase n=1 Tax=Oricola nitratireducens TaxID=2775868 RepID=UPI00186864C1|nr:lysoplasmalogenase [Oricola nitratireducens]